MQNGYLLALDKLVLDEECAQVQSGLSQYISEHGVFGTLHATKLSQYISEHGVFGTLHATKDRERLHPIRWRNMYGNGATYLHKLEVRVLS